MYIPTTNTPIHNLKLDSKHLDKVKIAKIFWVVTKIKYILYNAKD